MNKSMPRQDDPQVAPAGGKSNKPVEEIRIGTIRASIWANPNQNGVVHNVTLTRFYKSGDEWRRSDSFGRDDLLTVAKLADLAHSWICEQQATRAQK